MAPSVGGGATGCPTHTVVCFVFDKDTAQFPTTNTATDFANYNGFNGGSYQVGTRVDTTTHANLPALTVSNDNSVQIDVDATPASTAPPQDRFGVDCFGHQGQAGFSAVFFFVNASGFQIGVSSDEDGSPVSLVSESNPPPLNAGDGRFNHITAICAEQPAKGDQNPGLKLTLEINNQTVADTVYYDGTGPWFAAAGAKFSTGVIANGKDANDFYDNFSLSVPTA